MQESNIIPHNHKIGIAERAKLNGHKPLVLWFVGLSGSGKSTLASELEHRLHLKGTHTYILDGDNIRSGLNDDLGFSETSRKENLRRIGEVAKLMADAGLVVLSAFITPFQEDREKLKSLIGKERFVEIFVNCPLEECEKRDVKGLYAKARKGLIKDFTGISSPFEEPINPDLEIRTDQKNLNICVDEVLEWIGDRLNIENK